MAVEIFMTAEAAADEAKPTSPIYFLRQALLAFRRMSKQ